MGASEPLDRESKSAEVPGKERKPEIRLSETDRIQGFSDGFFAIAITLLVLEFDVPRYDKGHLSTALFEFLPSLFAFLLSFSYIGIIWLNHHALFNHIKYVDKNIHFINLGILLTTVLLCFPTALLADAFQNGNGADKSTAVALYSATAGLMSLSWVPVFEYIIKHNELLDSHSNPHYFKQQRVRPWLGVLFYALAALIGGWEPILAILIFLLVIVYHAITSEGARQVIWMTRSKRTNEREVS